MIAILTKLRNRIKIAIVSQCMGVSKNSKNKGAAYNFIKAVLEAQESSARMLYMPINKKAVQKAKEDYLTNEVGKKEKIDKNTYALMEKPSEALDKCFNSISENIEKGVITDVDLEDMMQECFKPYFENKTSYDNAVKQLENKLNIYINE